MSEQGADFETTLSKTPLRFPDPRAEAHARAQEFGRLSSDERFAEIAALMAAGFRMVRHSPRRDAILKRWDEEEANWQRIQRKLFEEHGLPTDERGDIVGA
jgi:hypothetical protein